MKKGKKKATDFVKNKENNNLEDLLETQEMEQKTGKEEDAIEREAETKENDFENLQQKISDLNDKNLRLMAEFDNYRKRTLKERSDLLKTAGEGVLGNMLPLVDDFDRAMKAMETAQNIEAVKEGIELIYEKFIAFLAQNGVKEILTEAQPFDTDLHEAVTTFPAPSEDMKGKIMDCVSKGYTLNDKVIRYPKVVVCE